MRSKYDRRIAFLRKLCREDGIETWRRHCYPVPAHEAVGSVQEALEHGLRKWKGLRPEVLEQYGLKARNSVVIRMQDYRPVFDVDGSSCALCKIFRRSVPFPCSGCPILFYPVIGDSGRPSSVGLRCDEYSSPYYTFLRTGDPGPMIRALEEALEREKSACGTK
jgi:hypothetical protein